MKKILIVLCVCVLTLVSLFSVACGGGKEPETVQPIGKVCLNDFETYRPDFQLIRVLDKFGAINVNTDKNYVKSGNSSAKLQPLGGYRSTSSPLMYVPLLSYTFNYDYRDLSRVRQVTAEVYNAEDFDVNMSFGLVMEVINTDMINKTNPVKCVLKPGWNTVTYDVDVSVISILYDVTDAQGVYFSFESTGSRYIEDAPVLYLDDVNLMFSAKPATVENLLSFSQNEICNFDKLYQRYVAYTEAENPAAEPTINVVRASDFGVEATSGDNVLCLTTKPGNGGGTYQRLIFPEGFMSASALPKVDEKDYDNTYFCFDLYAVDSSMVFYPEFFDNGYNTCYNKWACDAGTGKWSTYRIKLTELKSTMVSKPGFFRLAWSEYDVSKGEQVFLLDSFRIEKA